ncbi:hypothetical protein M231_05912 [Tremella mesenterica]|uniref:NADP-dependent oxidoreductase domain-containing protein n=1 Tax=Tremella mesenterica TaxID=5217 RepID=A0A4Q1BGX3_TREME|nr:uncharacterized protein TREMEDRAFT_29315 [Tremella mesenterica DSM 1558]EIW70880.1 hypothetical protein TREMEDRAFT_29315 [Tremella mesenterica DSM 1558]RXK36828.1 hypothetical protein M231_05912 [Tremella mesenterica]
MAPPHVELAGKDVGRIGYGLMQLTWTPKPVPEEESFAAMKAAADNGCVAWSTATFYGNPGHHLDNLTLIGKFFKKYPEYSSRVVIVCKGGSDENIRPVKENRLDFYRNDLKNINSLLGRTVDVYSVARLPPGIPIEEVFADLKVLKDEGLCKEIGASEMSAPSLEKANKIVPIKIVEIEVSLWSWDTVIQDAVKWCGDHKVPIFCYSPLGRGFIIRKFKTPEDIPDGSFQKYLPRFQGEAFYENLKLVDQLDESAEKAGVTTGQLALAWILSLNDYTIPIPGSSNPSRITENAAAANITLSEEDKKTLNSTLAKFDPKGGRYPDFMKGLQMQ